MTTASTFDPFDLLLTGLQQLLAAPSVVPFDDDETPVLADDAAARVIRSEIDGGRRLVPTDTYTDELAAAAVWRASAPGRTIGHAVAEAMIDLVATGHLAIAAKSARHDLDQTDDSTAASLHVLRSDDPDHGDDDE